MTTRHDFGGVLGPPLDTFFLALTISRNPALGLKQVELDVGKTIFLLAKPCLIGYARAQQLMY